MKALRAPPLVSRPALTRRCRGTSQRVLSLSEGASAGLSEEASARAAAAWAVDYHVKDGYVVGLGDGPLVALATEHLGRKLRDGHLKGVSVLPASALAAAQAAVNGVPVQPGLPAPAVDVLFEQPDALDADWGSIAYVTGRSCVPAQPELERLAAMRVDAKSIVLIAEPDALMPPGTRLCGSVPVLVDDEDWEETAELLDDVFIGDASLWRRGISSSLTDPRGGDAPYTSAEGQTILDILFEDEGTWHIDGEAAGPDEVAELLDQADGVLAHGIVVRGVTAAIVAQPGQANPTILFPSGSS